MRRPPHGQPEAYTRSRSTTPLARPVARSHAQTRLLALQRFAERSSQDPVAMLCEDDPFISYAPLRMMDIQVDAF